MAIIINFLLLTLMTIFPLKDEAPPPTQDSIPKPLILKLEKLHKKGYLEAHLIKDEYNAYSINKEKPTHFYIHTVKVYGDNNLFVTHISHKNSSYSWKQYQRYLLNILRLYENNGYPFVRIEPTLDSLVKHTAYLKLKIYSGEAIYIDSIIQQPRQIFPQALLYQWLQIRLQELYSEKKLIQLRQKIQVNPWCEEIQPPQVKFKATAATIFLFLKKKKSNSVEGIVGFSRNGQNKWTLTGQGNIHLINTLNLGDEFSFKWIGFQQSQTLNVQAQLPYILHFNLGGSAQVNIYKRDTTYVKVEQRYDLIDFMYPHRITLYYKNQQNIPLLLNNPTAEYLAHSRHYLGGILFSLSQVDEQNIPRRGWNIAADVNGGIKKVFPASMDTGMIKKSNILNVLLNGKLLVPFLSFWGIFIQGTYHGIYAPNVKLNEGLLLGGFSNLRGFDENSQVWMRYLLTTFENRFFFEKTSFFSLFTDFCTGTQWIDNRWKNKSYVSFGVGVSFSTKSGIFQLYYALGKNLPGHFDVRLGKIHAGYQVRF